MEDNRPESGDTSQLYGKVVIRSLKDAQAFSQINHLLREELHRLGEEAFGWKCNYAHANEWLILELFETGTFLAEFVIRLYKLQEYVNFGLDFKLEIEGLRFLQDNTAEILNVLQNTHARQ